MAARRRPSSRRRRGRRGGSFGILYKLLSILVICCAVVAALTLFFRIDTVEVTGEQHYTADEIITATGVRSGDNLFLMNKYDIAQSIVKKLPYIEEIRIKRQLPDTLVVEVKECSTPLAVVQDGFAWFISPTGKIVDQKEEKDVGVTGVIDGCELLAPSVGSSLALATEYATQQTSLLNLLAALNEAGLLDQVGAIHLGDLSILSMEYMNRFTVEMPYGADYQRLLLILQFAIGKLESNEKGTIRLSLNREYGAIFTPKA